MKKTALVLSGGGSRGGYEIGVWKALDELGMNIDMVFGTSVGAINGAMVAQDRLELSGELWLTLETGMIFDLKDEDGEAEKSVLAEKMGKLAISGIPAEEALAYAKEIVANGGAGSSGLKAILEKYIDEDNVRKSPRDYGLVVTEFPSMKGRRLYKDDIPEGQLIDYILASASCFPAVQKYIIDDRKYIDGGYCDNLPVSMAVERGAERIIAVNLDAAGVLKKEHIRAAAETVEDFTFIESPISLGNFLVFDRINTERIMQLGYLDAMGAFGVYDGDRYTFEKGSFSAHDIRGAENAAWMVEMDPCIIYDRVSFVDTLASSFERYIKEREKGIEDARADMARIFSQDTKKDALTTLMDIVKQKNDDIDVDTSLVMYIAKSLREDDADSFFLKPAVFRMLSGEISAANFMVKYGIL